MDNSARTKNQEPSQPLIFDAFTLCQSWVGLTSDGVVQGRGLIGWRDLQLFFKYSLPGMYSLHVPEMPLVKRQQGHRV